MGDIGTFQHRENARHADAVVRTERSAIGTHPVAVHHHANALGHEVELSRLVFLAHHVHMALENDGFSPFKSRSCFFLNQHVAYFVLK